MFEVLSKESFGRWSLLLALYASINFSGCVTSDNRVLWQDPSPFDIPSEAFDLSVEPEACGEWRVRCTKWRCQRDWGCMPMGAAEFVRDNHSHKEKVEIYRGGCSTGGC